MFKTRDYAAYLYMNLLNNNCKINNIIGEFLSLSHKIDIEQNYHVKSTKDRQIRVQKSNSIVNYAGNHLRIKQCTCIPKIFGIVVRHFS